MALPVQEEQIGIAKQGKGDHVYDLQDGIDLRLFRGNMTEVWHV